MKSLEYKILPNACNFVHLTGLDVHLLQVHISDVDLLTLQISLCVETEFIFVSLEVFTEERTAVLFFWVVTLCRLVGT